MQSLTVPANPQYGYIASLSEMLARIAQNDWTWSLLAFEGIGIAPNAMSMQALEDFLHCSAQGLLMTWQELLDFAQRVEQVSWCFIVAVDSPDKIRKPVEVDAAPEGCIMALEVFDGTEWIVWSDDCTLLKPFSAS